MSEPPREPDFDDERAKQERQLQFKQEVEDQIREFVALELSDPREFANAFATNLREPDAVETAAFRSNELAEKSLTAAKFLRENTRIHLKSRRRGSAKQYTTQGFLALVNRETRLLESIVAAMKAKRGILPNAPNPRQRAYVELARRYPREYLSIVREKEEEVRQERLAAKKSRQKARRAARAQQER